MAALDKVGVTPTNCPRTARGDDRRRRTASLRGNDAPEEMADHIFDGHADPAMELDGAMAHGASGLGDLHLAGRDCMRRRRQRPYSLIMLRT